MTNPMCCLYYLTCKSLAILQIERFHRVMFVLSKGYKIIKFFINMKIYLHLHENITLYIHTDRKCGTFLVHKT